MWQDVYVWEGLGGAGGVSSSQVNEQTHSYKGCTVHTPAFDWLYVKHRNIVYLFREVERAVKVGREFLQTKLTNYRLSCLPLTI